MKLIFRDMRRWRFWRHLGVHTFAGVGFQAVAVGLIDILFPKAFDENGGRIALVVLALSVVYGVVRAWPRPIQQSYSSPNTTIRLVSGDLFNQECHLVIGVSTTFDTSVPNIIVRNSVQGQFLEREYNNDLGALDTDLANALAHVTPTGSIAKPGKTDRYPLGTVAVLRDRSRCFFCVAYTEMNEQNEARATADGVWRSLDSLWRSVSAYGNGGPVAIPVIGGGQARLSQVLPAQDAIRFMILSFLLASRKEKICDELVVVVQPKEYEDLDRLEIQAFLRSLKRS